LSLTQDGLPNYGDLHCRLHSFAVARRTSFLESNSYKFVKDNSIEPGDQLPDGYMADWNSRHNLVLAKVGDRISTGQTESDWQKILVKSDVNNRENDDFIEAHIYGSFDKHAIESIIPVNDKRLTRNEKLDIAIAREKFKKLKGQPE